MRRKTRLPEYTMSQRHVGHTCRGHSRGDLPADGCSEFCVAEVLDIQPGDLVITEIMQNPAVVSDGAGEWFEVYNATDAPIDLFGFVVRDDDTDTHTIVENVIVPAGAYVVQVGKRRFARITLSA